MVKSLSPDGIMARLSFSRTAIKIPFFQMVSSQCFFSKKCEHSRKAILWHVMSFKMFEYNHVHVSVLEFFSKNPRRETTFVNL